MTNDLLRRVLEQQSATGRTERITNFIADELRAIDPTITIKRKKGNLYATKGHAEVYPCVVAHTDTVHSIIPDADFLVYEAGDLMFAWDKGRREQTGIGGDDKVGIYIALRAVEALPNVKVAFFRDEEVGCQGARVANMQFFNDCAFVLQCDRRGYGDFVNDAGWTELHDDEFATAVEPILTSWGFKPSSGSMTDVMELKDRGLKVAAANMSCGYYRPHTAEEYVAQSEVEAVESMVLEICETLGDRQFLHSKPTYRSFKTTYGTSEWDRESSYYDSQSGTSRYASHYDKDTKRYVSRCEDCKAFIASTRWRIDHGSMECDTCYLKIEHILDQAEHRDIVDGEYKLVLPKEEGGQLALPNPSGKHLSVEDWNNAVILDADILRIRRDGPTDNDFMWAVDEGNNMWPDDFKYEVIQAYYELAGYHPDSAGEELLQEETA